MSNEEELTSADVAILTDVVTVELKGPADEHWGSEAREKRGAVIVPADDPSGYTRNDNGALVGDDNELVKGPGDEWSVDARSERGAS